MDQTNRTWKHICYEDRVEAEKAPELLIESIKQLVAAAYNRLGKRGKTDERGTKRIYLEIRNADKHMVFEISDVDVAEWDEPDFTERRRHLSCGLFIYAMNIGKDEIPLGLQDGIQVARNPSLVTAKSIDHLKGLAPEAVIEAVGDITKASVITELQWESFEDRIPGEIAG